VVQKGVLNGADWPDTVALPEHRLHAILFELVAKLDEVRERILVLRVGCHPLAVLSGRVNRVEGDRDLTLDVTPGGVQRLDGETTRVLCHMDLLGRGHELNAHYVFERNILNTPDEHPEVATIGHHVFYT
jgi:hypothetical protein